MIAYCTLSEVYPLFNRGEKVWGQAVVLLCTLYFRHQNKRLNLCRKKKCWSVVGLCLFDWTGERERVCVCVCVCVHDNCVYLDWKNKAYEFMNMIVLLLSSYSYQRVIGYRFFTKSSLRAKYYCSWRHKVHKAFHVGHIWCSQKKSGKRAVAENWISWTKENLYTFSCLCIFTVMPST